MRQLLFLLFLASCGGGGGGYTAAPQELGQRTDKIQFGYYGSCVSCLEATRDHIGFYMVMDWDGDGIAQMQQAKAFGIPVILYLPEAYQSEEATVRRFRTLQSLDLLGNIKAVYPVDEPDLAGYSTERIGVTNALIRRVTADMGMSVPLAVIYTDRETYPGIEYYDWIGFDAYSENIFTGGKYANLKSRLRSDQRIILVPGGADPWSQDPAPFLSKAKSDPQVIAIMAFLWRDRDNSIKGIGSNGMAPAYRAVGLTTKAKP